MIYQKIYQKFKKQMIQIKPILKKVPFYFFENEKLQNIISDISKRKAKVKSIKKDCGFKNFVTLRIWCQSCKELNRNKNKKLISSNKFLKKPIN